MKLTIGIVGYRYYTNYDEFKQVVDNYILTNNLNNIRICSGGASGADTLAETYAKDNNMEIIIHRAKWHKYGKFAGPKRNKLIVIDSDHLIAFVHDKSVGTLNTIKHAEEKGIPCFIQKIT